MDVSTAKETFEKQTKRSPVMPPPSSTTDRIFPRITFHSWSTNPPFSNVALNHTVPFLFCLCSPPLPPNCKQFLTSGQTLSDDISYVGSQVPFPAAAHLGCFQGLVMTEHCCSWSRLICCSGLPGGTPSIWHFLYFHIMSELAAVSMFARFSVLLLSFRGCLCCGEHSSQIA